MSRDDWIRERDGSVETLRALLAAGLRVERAKILARLATQTGFSVDIETVFDVAAYASVIEGLVWPDSQRGGMWSVLDAGFSAGLTRVSAIAPIDYSAPIIAEVISEGTSLITTFSQTTAARIDTAFLRGYERAADLGTSDPIGLLFEEVDAVLTAEYQDRTVNGREVSSHARTFARTEGRASFEAAALESYTAAGLTHHTWQPTYQNTRASHLIAGETVAIGETFSNGCRYAGDVKAPPAERINCNCSTLPTQQPT